MGMRFLLDTQVLLWLATQPDRVLERVRADLASMDAEVFVSAVSAMEIATRTRLGKLAEVGLLDAWQARLDDMALGELPLSSAAALRAGTMAWEHCDPFDRMLVAQAIEHNLTLVTVDHAFCGLPAPRMLTW